MMILAANFGTIQNRFSLCNAQSCFARDILNIIDFISISYMTTAHLPVITLLINELRE